MDSQNQLPPSQPPQLQATQQAQAKQKKPKSVIKIIMIVIGALGLAFMTVIVTIIMWYRYQLRPLTSDDIYHVVSVQQGESSQEIAETLEEKRVIRSSSAFLWHIKLTGKNSLQAGSYRLSSKLSTPSIADSLVAGKVSSLDILIAPGLRLSQIKTKLKDAGFEESEVEAALKKARNHQLLIGVSEDQPLEGYLFPDTYRVGPDTTADQLVALMLNTFESKITPEIKAGLKKQGLSLAEGIILASIVQKEVSDYPNQQKVAQVFLKRLSEGTVLGSDVTYMYAAAETGQNATPTLDSPYNTRVVKGLPPSAIANFNIDALRAVANPAKTDFHYFVAGDDGTVYYSKTEAEHEALTRQHCGSCFQ